MLLAGLALGVVIASRGIFEESRESRLRATETQNYVRQVTAYNQCAAAIEKSGEYGELLDMVIEGRCPAKPVRPPLRLSASADPAGRPRATDLGLAGIVTLLASLPWLASRLTRAGAVTQRAAQRAAPNAPR